MAASDIRLRVSAETTQLQRDIKKSLKSGYSLGGLDTKRFAAPLGRIKGQLGEFEKSMEAANARVIAFGASTGAIYAVTSALKHLVQSSIEVEKTLTDINSILGVSEKSLANFLTSVSVLLCKDKTLANFLTDVSIAGEHFKYENLCFT